MFVVDGGQRLLGTLPLDDLVIADPDAPIGPLVQEPVAYVETHEDQEQVGPPDRAVQPWRRSPS